jgi:PAS domain S-box-containing protein
MNFLEKQNKFNFDENNFILKNAFEYSSIGMAIVDINGNFLKVNKFISEMTCYSTYELNNMNIKDLTYLEDFEQYISYINLLINAKIDEFDMDKRCLDKNKKIIWVNIAVSKIKENNLEYFFLLIEDITSKKEAQFDLLIKTMKLEELNHNLQHFSYFISHDLQEPLRNINKLILELQKHEELKENEAIESLFQYSKRMRTFISDLLTYAQAGNKLKLDFIDCNVVLDRVLENLSVLINEHNAKITYEYLPDIKFNALKLEQILQNIISNSIKYSKKDINPEINILCIEEEFFWKFIIKDNGIGIDSENFQSIFQVFNRGFQEYKYSGSGIGLAVCKKIIDQHGGKIWLESDIGIGTTFYFTIPYSNNN